MGTGIFFHYLPTFILGGWFGTSIVHFLMGVGIVFATTWMKLLKGGHVEPANVAKIDMFNITI